MQKIKLKIKMISEFPEEKKCEGFLNDGIISYIEESKTKVEVDLNNRKVSRDSFDKLLVVDYRREVIHLNLKEYNYNMDMPITCIKDIHNDNYFSIKYKLEDNEIEYILEYEEI